MSGSTKATTYSLSLISNKEDGVQIESGYERKLINFHLDTKANHRAWLDINAGYPPLDCEPGLRRDLAPAQHGAVFALQYALAHENQTGPHNSLRTGFLH